MDLHGDFICGGLPVAAPMIAGEIYASEYKMLIGLQNAFKGQKVACDLCGQQPAILYLVTTPGVRHSEEALCAHCLLKKGRTMEEVKEKLYNEMG